MRMRALLLLASVWASACSYPEFAFSPGDAAVPADTNVVIDANSADTIANSPDVTAAKDATDAADSRDAKETGPSPRTWLFDFGAATFTTPGYNNLTESHAKGGTLSALVDSTGVKTTASLRIDSTDSFHSSNESGSTTASGLFPATATRDSFFGETVVFMGELHPRATLELLGLNAGYTYDVEIFASRMAGTGVLESAYTVRGVAAPTTQYLDANDNLSKTVTFTRVQPSSTGWISLSITAGPKNTSPNGFFYLGAMRVTEVIPAD